jgi:hypothetical protein
MATLQVRSIDDKLYDMLGKVAKDENRSISQEVVYILKRYFSKPEIYSENPTDAFLSLSLDDERSADEIISDIYSSRSYSQTRKIEEL